MNSSELNKKIYTQRFKRQQIIELLAKGYLAQDDPEWYAVLIDLTNDINDLKNRATDEEIEAFFKEAYKKDKRNEK